MEYKRLYIAYGSNINLEQMAHRCPNSKVVSTEMMQGYCRFVNHIGHYY